MPPPTAAAAATALAAVAAAAAAFHVARRRSRATLDLTGRWVVITGCDSGFGAAAVQQLCLQGTRVIAFTRTPEGAARALDAGAAVSRDFDLTDDAALAAAAAAAVEACGGRLWALVHNAGLALGGHFAYQTMGNFRAVMGVNFFAPVALTQLLLPALAAERGRVVFVSSVAGLLSFTGNSPYDASKHALEALAGALRLELEAMHIRVCAICPANMKTPMVRNFSESLRRTWQAMAASGAPFSPWVASVYTPQWLDGALAHTQKAAAMSDDPRHAVAAIVHAVSARQPRTRYLPGRIACWVFWTVWCLPEAWGHAALRALLGPLVGPRASAVGGKGAVAGVR